MIKGVNVTKCCVIDIFQPFTRSNWKYCNMKENTTGNGRTNIRLRCIRIKIVAVKRQINITYSKYVFVALI